MAIALLEFLGQDAAVVQAQIFATDVSDTAIEVARGGLYPGSIEEQVSPERLRRFFTRVTAATASVKSSATCASSPSRTSRAIRLSPSSTWWSAATS